MSIQSVTLMSKDVSHEGITEASEVMPVNGSGNQVANKSENCHMMLFFVCIFSLAFI